jgi:hypothetical protein
MLRPRLHTLALISILVLGVLLAGAPAQAAPGYPPPTPSPSPSQPGNTISITVVTPGGTITINISGFHPREVIIIVIHSTPVQLASVAANASGAASATFTIPNSIPTGLHTITATGLTSGHVVSFPVRVEQATAAGAGPGLSNTGVAAVALGTVAGIFLIGGIAFTVAGRRRNNAARAK